MLVLSTLAFLGTGLSFSRQPLHQSHQLLLTESASPVMSTATTGSTTGAKRLLAHGHRAVVGLDDLEALGRIQVILIGLVDDAIPILLNRQHLVILPVNQFDGRGLAMVPNNHQTTHLPPTQPLTSRTQAAISLHVKLSCPHIPRADSERMLGLMTRLSARLAEINDGSYVVEDLETSFLASL